MERLYARGKNEKLILRGFLLARRQRPRVRRGRVIHGDEDGARSDGPSLHEATNEERPVALIPLERNEDDGEDAKSHEKADDGPRVPWLSRSAILEGQNETREAGQDYRNAWQV